jgi:hypothetical protein
MPVVRMELLHEAPRDAFSLADGSVPPAQHILRNCSTGLLVYSLHSVISTLDFRHLV